jgi:preprotein translocase subunit SecE
VWYVHDAGPSRRVAFAGRAARKATDRNRLNRGRGTVTDVGQTRTPSRSSKGKGRDGNVFSRWFRALKLFISQILDELRKVVRPTRNELWNYTIVVIVFVTVMMALVSSLDLGFTKLVSLVFG